MRLVHAIYEPKGDGPHPTILALHGWGANALDLLGLAPHVGHGRFLFLCPQGPLEVPLGPMRGYGWFPITMGAPPDPYAFAAAVRELRSFLDDALARYPVNPHKLVCLGFSQGGVMAYALALSEPHRFAALVALSSWLPAALVRELPPADRSQLATLVHHGTRDELIDVSRGRESLEHLRSLRVPAAYREFDMGHEISAQSLADLSRWLEDKVLSPIVTL
ncbi:MAG: phospholipase [Candidatus Binatia bacterium]|nr:MAG: phospholipase [Candidatus Binatia bacterium]